MYKYFILIYVLNTSFLPILDNSPFYVQLWVFLILVYVEGMLHISGMYLFISLYHFKYFIWVYFLRMHLFAYTLTSFLIFDLWFGLIHAMYDVSWLFIFIIVKYKANIYHLTKTLCSLSRYAHFLLLLFDFLSIYACIVKWFLIML